MCSSDLEGSAQMSFGTDRSKRRWKDIWGSGHGIGAVREVVPARALVARLRREYHAARARLGGGNALLNPAWERVVEEAAAE